MMICACTSKRTPCMPRGSCTFSRRSITKYCGNTCKISCPSGTGIARAAANTFSMSAAETSVRLTGITPWELTDDICPPAMPIVAEVIFIPAINSASATALRIERTVRAISTTTPLCKPSDGDLPMPITSIDSSCNLRAMSTQFLLSLYLLPQLFHQHVCEPWLTPPI